MRKLKISFEGETGAGKSLFALKFLDLLENSKGINFKAELKDEDGGKTTINLEWEREPKEG